MPGVYLFPATVWNDLNSLFVSHDYDKPGQKSEPEWGINFSKKNKEELEKYRIEKFIR